MSELVCAWNLAAGDTLPGGDTVLSVEHDKASGRVRVAEDDGSVLSLSGTVRLVVVERRPLAARAEPPLSPRERFKARQRLDIAADEL